MVVNWENGARKESHYTTAHKIRSKTRIFGLLAKEGAVLLSIPRTNGAPALIAASGDMFL